MKLWDKNNEITSLWNMPKKRLTESQKGFLSLTTRVEADLTQEERFLLGFIVKQYDKRSNFLKENGYVHASIRTIKNECGIGQDTIEQARIKLQNEGLITCEIGRAKVHNTRFSLTEKTKKYIYVPESVPEDEKSVPISVPIDENSVPMSVPIDEKVHDEQTKRIESLELKINELIEDKKRLTEEIENLKKYIGIGVGIEQSCNSSCIHLSNLNNSTQNTIPERSCTSDVDEEVFQIETEDEQVKRKKSPCNVSSSLQLIEEENHPDANADADGVTIPSNESISNDERTTADRLSSSQLDSKTQPQPLDKGKALEEAFNPYISKWVKGLSSYDVIVNRDVAQFAVLEPFLRDNPDYTSENCVTLTYMFGVSVELMQCALNKVRKYGNMYPELENTSETLREAS